MKQEHNWFLKGSVSLVHLQSAGRKYCRKVSSGGAGLAKDGCPHHLLPEVTV